VPEFTHGRGPWNTVVQSRINGRNLSVELFISKASRFGITLTMPKKVNAPAGIVSHYDPSGAGMVQSNAINNPLNNPVNHAISGTNLIITRAQKCHTHTHAPTHTHTHPGACAGGHARGGSQPTAPDCHPIVIILITVPPQSKGKLPSSPRVWDHSTWFESKPWSSNLRPRNCLVRT
jgi:hypothetical protein